jgi:hypothetical protein
MPRVDAARAQSASQSRQHHQHRIPGQLMLIMTIGPLPDACRRTKTGDSLRIGSGVSWRSSWPGAYEP